MELSEHARQNRAAWDAHAATYQTSHGEFIAGDETCWGSWRIPESDVQVLGDVAGKDVLDLGCGACQFGVTLARRGARVTGIDISEKQLEYARLRGVDFPLVLGSADDLQFEDASFDVVACDQGATVFADPFDVVPEVARVLRPGGLFAFSGATPIDWICWDESLDRASTTLQRDYFGMHRWQGEGWVYFMLPYGGWIQLFRSCGFTIEDLV